MISPVLVATWIAYCVPFSEPLLVNALVQAGSAGDPWLVSDASGKKLGGATEAESAAILRDTPAATELYVGLAQIPRSSMRQLGIPAEIALDACTNLRIAYQLFTAAHDYAGTLEKSPWKTLGLAFSWYRTHQRALDGDYVTKAVELVRKGSWGSPAPYGSRMYFAVAAEASTAHVRLSGIDAGQFQVRSLIASNALTRHFGRIN